MLSNYFSNIHVYKVHSMVFIVLMYFLLKLFDIKHIVKRNSQVCYSLLQQNMFQNILLMQLQKHCVFNILKCYAV